MLPAPHGAPLPTITHLATSSLSARPMSTSPRAPALCSKAFSHLPCLAIPCALSWHLLRPLFLLPGRTPSVVIGLPRRRRRGCMAFVVNPRSYRRVPSQGPESGRPGRGGSRGPRSLLPSGRTAWSGRPVRPTEPGTMLGGGPAGASLGLGSPN